jgi:hypothetical protein
MININDYNIKVGDRFRNIKPFNDPTPTEKIGVLKVPAGVLFEVIQVEFPDRQPFKERYYRIHFTYTYKGEEVKSWFSNGSENSKSCFMSFREDNLERLGI